ncbi:hypothetical protein A0H81_12405 [Grifola frondosa]|uniref:Cytochrome P450 n=1 Tax=Grifola frondosa TaxID=5627 RepID=A0A1C7LTR9_GRIFR|nr:hypothetical protein A0H81_12405 [Grifola frondosa]
MVAQAWRVRRNWLGYRFSGESVNAWPEARVTMLLADPVAIKEVTSSRARFPKPVEQYKVLSFFGSNIVITEGDEWKRQRKIAAPAFSERNNKLVWDESVNIVLDLFDNVWGTQDSITVDHIVDLTVPDALHEVSTKLHMKVILPDWVLNWGPTETIRRFKLAYDNLERYMAEMVQARKTAEKKEERYDLFSSLLDANEEESEGQMKLSDSELIGNIFIFLIAGHETTAHTLAFTFALLALYPDEQEILYQHIKSVLPNGRRPNYEDMGSLSYSMACVIFQGHFFQKFANTDYSAFNNRVFNETLRMFPPVLGIPKSSAEDTTLVTSNAAGEKLTVPVPQGTYILLHTPGLHYNPRYWEDPHVFKPSRFLGDWPRDAFLPFSGGPRACVGRRFSETEAVAILSLIISRYKVEVKEEPQFAGETFEQRRERLLKCGSSITIYPGFFICCVSWILWKYFPQKIGKSTLDNIPGPPPQSFWKGNIDQLFDRHAWSFHQELNEKYGSVVKLHSIFGQKFLYVYDPKALHSIIVKDQHIYEESAFLIKTPVNVRRSPPQTAEAPESSVLDQAYAPHDASILPNFSQGKRASCLLTVLGSRLWRKLCDAIESGVRAGVGEVDMLGWMGRTALELIGQAGLGYSFDPLVEDVPNPYGDAIKNYLPVLSRLQILRRMIPFIPQVGPPALRRKVVEMFPHKGVKHLISIVDAMHTHSTEIFEKKKEVLIRGDEAISQEIEEKDIMSILLKANIAASEADRLPEHELIAQMSTLTFAAMDTTSNALSLILQLLAEHSDVQNRVRKEILEASNGGDLPYDELIELPYLDAVCRETLRLRAPATFVFRETRKDIVMPLLEPIRGVDGSIINEIPVPKNTGIVVGVLASNCNKAVWGDDALEWKPERWLSPLPETVSEAHIPGVYSNLMTFLGGGRACIGFKFSQLEMKVVLSLLLSKFTFSLSDKPIVWNLAGVRYPTVGKDSTKPEMWLKVGLLNNVA